jgi:hypothetical protein
MDEREWFKSLDPESRIAVTVQGRPPRRYVVRLETLVEGSWQTVHLFDNAHDRHDEHVYLSDEKQTASEFFLGPVAQALPTAIELLDRRWAAIIQRWKERLR